MKHLSIKRMTIGVLIAFAAVFNISIPDENISINCYCIEDVW